MSFKINDYNAFLSSLVERERDASGTSPTGVVFNDQQAGEEKFPMDFDFYIQQRDKQNMNSEGNDASNQARVSDISSRDIPNAGISSHNNSVSMSVSPTSNEIMGRDKDNEIIDNLINQDQLYTADMRSGYLGNYNNKFTNQFPPDKSNTYIKQESSDDDVLSPDLDLPDTFYHNFDNINNINHPLSGSMEQRGGYSGAALNKARSTSDTLSSSSRAYSLPSKDKKHHAIKMAPSPHHQDQNFGSPQSSVSKSYLDEKPKKGASDTDENKPFRPRMKSSHNVIEQRYRNKINDKFTALQDSVPTLRIAAKRKQKQEDTMEDDPIDPEHYELSDSENDDLEGLEPARKLNKGIILSKSIEYIKFLELKNGRMREQRKQLLEKAKLLGLQVDEFQL